MSRWRRAGAVASAAAAVATIVVSVSAAGPAPARTVVAAPSTPDLHAVAPVQATGRGRQQPVLHCSPSARACVDLRHRLAWLQVGGRVTYGPVRTGTALPAHRTPRGVFRVEWKAEHWVSTEYGIPMPWSVFFATGGIAFHAGPLDQPSHGCVHLARSAARRFFDALVVGDRIDVH